MANVSHMRRWLALATTAMLAACAGGGKHSLVADTPVKLGRPYTVGGRVYQPYDDTQYDRIGLASWYGDREQGHDTANGERFDRRRVSAAHPTLPMPSYVTVTRLDTGRTMLVRINDRGPYARDRILDLSEEAARQLGIVQAGSALVRVRRVSPTASERNLLRRGYPVILASVAPTATPPRTGRTAPVPSPSPYAAYPQAPVATPYATPPQPAPSAELYPAYPQPPANAAPVPAPPPPDAEYLPAPTPETYGRSAASQPGHVPLPPADTGDMTAPAPIAAPHPVAAPHPATSPSSVRPSGGRDILVATPSDPDAADALASALSAEHGHVVPAGTTYRVVTGPYPDEAARAAALARLHMRGYQGAAALDAPTSP